MPPAPPINLLIIGQQGRLQYEAVLFAASLRASGTAPRFRLHVAVPQPGPLWQSDPRIIDSDVLELLHALGATLLPFESRHFGEAYPNGNKIEALAALPKDQPFVFFDTDTLVLDDLARVPFDFDRPTASLRRTGTWPEPQLYGPGYTEIWRSLYDRFDLDFDSSLDLSQPDEYWQRYLYFNAGFFFYRCPQLFGQRFAAYATMIRDAPPAALAGQSLDPWLDQVALPLVIHSFGGGRDALPPGLLDGDVTCHYRLLPLLYARESDHVVTVLEQVSAPNRIKRVLKQYEPFRRMIFQGRGARVREMFDRDALPPREQTLRNQIKKAGLWMR